MFLSQVRGPMGRLWQSCWVKSSTLQLLLAPSIHAQLCREGAFLFIAFRSKLLSDLCLINTAASLISLVNISGNKSLHGPWFC